MSPRIKKGVPRIEATIDPVFFCPVGCSRMQRFLKGYDVIQKPVHRHRVQHRDFCPEKRDWTLLPAKQGQIPLCGSCHAGSLSRRLWDRVLVDFSFSEMDQSARSPGHRPQFFKLWYEAAFWDGLADDDLGRRAAQITFRGKSGLTWLAMIIPCPVCFTPAKPRS